MKLNWEQRIVKGVFEPLAKKAELRLGLSCYRLSKMLLLVVSIVGTAIFLSHVEHIEMRYEHCVCITATAFAILSLIAESGISRIEEDRRTNLAFGMDKNHELKGNLFRMLCLAFGVAYPLGARAYYHADPLEARYFDFVLIMGPLLYAGLAFKACDPAYLTSSEE